MKTFVVAVTAMMALDVFCAFINAALLDDKPDPWWVRPLSRITSFTLALWGVWVIAGGVHG